MGGSDGGLAVVAMQHSPYTNNNSSSSRSSAKMETNVCMRSRDTDSFPAGMSVLVVDDDPICLLLLENLLRRCQYQGKGNINPPMLMAKTGSACWFGLMLTELYLPSRVHKFNSCSIVGANSRLNPRGSTVKCQPSRFWFSVCGLFLQFLRLSSVCMHNIGFNANSRQYPAVVNQGLSLPLTTCGQAVTALKMLRENKDKFDLVISDVCMPDMDGFKLLELVGLEMDLPVIMMSANGETSAVMKGITHGACDYLLKPVRIEELKNIWQHVVRKKQNGTKDNDHSGMGDKNDRNKREMEDGEHGSSANDGIEGSWKLNKKRKDQKEDDAENEHENDDPSALKKPRVVWSVELHQQFVSAVNQLGIDKAVPKRIMELMNVQGLTRENVASHLQKYRLYLKRLSGVANQQGCVGGAFGGGREFSFGSLASVDGLGNLQALAASGQFSTHAITSLQSGVLGRLSSPGGLGISCLNSSGTNQLPALQGSNTNTLGRAQLTLQSMNTPGKLFPHFPSGHELEQIQQKQQISRLGGVGAPMDEPAQFHTIQHQLTAENGLISAVPSAGASGHLTINPMKNALMLQYMQQQQQKQCRGLVNLPTAGIGSQQQGPNNTSGVSAQLSNTSGINGNWGNSVALSGVAPNTCPRGDSVNTTNMPVQNMPESFQNVTDTDCKPMDVLVALNGGLTDGVNMVLSAPSLTAVAGPSQNFIRRKDSGMGNASASSSNMGDLNEIVSSNNDRSNFPLLGRLSIGLRQGLDQNTKQGWESQSKDFRHITNPVSSPQFSRVSTVSQKLVGTYCAQAQAQNPGFNLQKMSFAVRPPMDLLVPFLGEKHDSEQSTLESQLKFREDHPPDPVKMERSFLTENGNSVDDLMSIVLKQVDCIGLWFPLHVEPVLSIIHCYILSLPISADDEQQELQVAGNNWWNLVFYGFIDNDSYDHLGLVRMTGDAIDSSYSDGQGINNLEARQEAT
eukprot:Gb_02800 [translate_table: standard]